MDNYKNFLKRVIDNANDQNRQTQHSTATAAATTAAPTAVKQNKGPTKKGPQSPPQPTTDKTPHNAQPSTAINNRARHLASQGAFGKAAAALDPNKLGVMVIDERKLQLLRELHPPPASREEAGEEPMEKMEEDRSEPQADPLTQEKENLPDVDENILDEALKACDRTAAAGPSGWCRDLCLAGPAFPRLTFFKRMIWDIVQGQVPEGVSEWLFGGRITPLEK
jgi:hypothetical protein